MLVIRKEQESAFVRARVDDFELRLTEHLEQNHPDCLPPDREERRRKIRYAIGRAHRAGMRTERRLSYFVVLLFAIGPRFYEQPEVAGILQAPGTDPELQTDYLAALITEDVWDAAALLVDPAWEALGPGERS